MPSPRRQHVENNELLLLAAAQAELATWAAPMTPVSFIAGREGVAQTLERLGRFMQSRPLLPGDGRELQAIYNLGSAALDELFTAERQLGRATPRTVEFLRRPDGFTIDGVHHPDAHRMAGVDVTWEVIDAYLHRQPPPRPSNVESARKRAWRFGEWCFRNGHDGLGRAAMGIREAGGALIYCPAHGVPAVRTRSVADVSPDPTPPSGPAIVRTSIAA